MRQWIREYRATIKRRKLRRELRALVTLGDCAQARRRTVARELEIVPTPRGTHFFFMSGHVDALPPDLGNRRYVAIDIDGGA